MSFWLVPHPLPLPHATRASSLLASFLVVGVGWATGCQDSAPGKAPPRKATPAERRIQTAPTINLIAAAEASRAEENDPLAPWVFRWPLANIDVTSPYGLRLHPVVRRLGFHAGVDLRAPRGEPVVAAGPGEVVQAGELPLTGLTVTLHHPGELATLYAHLDEILVFEGQRVSAGAPVGLIGSTGRSTGPHLHLSLYRLQGQGRHPLDPAELVGRVIDPRHPPSPPLPPPPQGPAREASPPPHP